MFNQQQQQFHQLMQLQHLLQQQQHPAQHHPTPRSIPPPVQHQQPQQMLNIRAAAPARLINTHPMFQRALLMQHMQGNLRGLNMAAPTMSPFFTARQSILGTPPMGVTVKAPRVGFPGLSFQQPQRMYLKDHHRTYHRKKNGEQSVTSHVKNEDIKQSEKGEIDLPPAASEADEESENLTECSVTDPSEPSAKRARSSSEDVAGECHFHAGEHPEEREGGVGERSVESQPPEGISGGRALKVTIQQRSESRTISTTDLAPSHTDRGCIASGSGQTGPRFCCYICKSNFQSLQAFQSHLVTARHHQRFQAIQHLSNACLVTLMPTAKDPQGSTAGRDGKKQQQQRWCNVCQVHFSSDLITHLRTQEHKLAKRSLRPFCTVCSRHFKTPRKFVEHMKSPEHKQKSQELRMWEKESWSPEESEELITVDAVGCFEEEDDEEDEDEGISGDEAVGNVQCPPTEREPLKEDMEEYNSEKAYGLDFMVPVTGYLCKLCHKFYSSDSASRLTHCKSLMHFQNVQRYGTTKNALNAAEASTSFSPKPESLEGVEAGASTDSDNTEWAEQMATIPDSLQAENGQGESYIANKQRALPVSEGSGADAAMMGSPGAANCLAVGTNESVGGLQQPDNIPAQGEKELINNEDSEAVTFQEEASLSSCHRLYRHKPR